MTTAWSVTEAEGTGTVYCHRCDSVHVPWATGPSVYLIIKGLLIAA